MKRRLAAIPVKEIDTSETLREVDHNWVRALADMMAQEGQVQPIEVAAKGAGFVLVFGLHRLLAADMLRWKTIDALVDDEGGDAAARRRRAVHENLFRRELSKLDRAIHISELYQLLQNDAPSRKRGGDRRSADFKLQRLQFGLAEDVADRVGLSERTVFAAIEIARGIGQSIRRRLSASRNLERIANSQVDLLALAAEAEVRQGKILDTIEDPENAATTVDEAIALLTGGLVSSQGEKIFNRVVNGWPRLSTDQRFSFLDGNESDVRAWALKRRWRP